MIPLGEYLPDQPALGQHSSIAKNCVPASGYYAPFKTPVLYGAALTEKALGAFSAYTTAGTAYNFVGTDSYLYRDNAGTWEDVSVAGGYNTGTGRWEFCQFGQRVIATNGVEKPQSYVMGSSTDFAVLTADDIIATTCAVVRGFVFFGNTTESAVNYPNRVKWSALEDPTDYTVSTTTQSDYQDLYGETDAGKVVKIIGGEYATIFCERGIFRGTYVSGDLIFTFDQIINNLGTQAPGSVVAFGETIFFLGNTGFYALTPSGLMPIGEGKINRTFFAELYTAEINKISAMTDPVNNLYIVAYPTESGTLSKVLIYNWVTQQWTYAEPTDVDCLFRFAVSDTFTDPTGFSAAVETSTKKIVTFTGTGMEATIETAEKKLGPGKTLIRNIAPIVEGTTSQITAYVGYRNTPNESVSYTSGKTANTEGECNLFNTARYQRVKLVINGGFEKAYGVDIDFTGVGGY
jgi:hypothetical protein